MAQTETVDVVIEGEVFKLACDEGEAHIQNIATYVNKKIKEMNQINTIAKSSPHVKMLLVSINIADDYFKADLELDEIKKNNKVLLSEKMILETKFNQTEVINKNNNIDITKELEHAKKQLEAELSKNAELKGKLEAYLESDKTNSNAFNKLLLEEKNKYAVLKKENEEKLKIMEQSLKEKNNYISKIEAENSLLKENINKLQNNLDLTKNDLASIKNNFDLTKNVLESTKTELESTKNELTSTKNALESTKNELDEFLENFDEK